MDFLITGGAGFIGSHLVESLVSQGHNITIIDDFNDYYDPSIKRNNISAILESLQVIKGDIRDSDLVDRTFSQNKFDTVVHLAARAGVRPSIVDPKLYLTTNVDGTFNLLESCKNHNVHRFTLASSSSVYGVNKKVPFSEDDRIERTISPYASTKIAAEQICSSYSHLFDIRTTCLRFFTVYGPRQRPDLAIAKFTKLIKAGLPIDQYGNGSTARDYTYIDDIISGVLAAITYDKKDFDVFNLGGSATTTLATLISIIEKAVGKKSIINQMPEQPGDVPKTFADTSKSERLLSYKPQTSITEGIKKYVDWTNQQIL
ncbi:MAG: UDP-glucuronate 4-epimerase [Cryomorphaceae bacterium]|jgi:UDP-glucuronate 4-epimerase